MPTYIVHVSVDADSKERAEQIVRDCIKHEVDFWINTEEDECAVVLDTTDEIEDSKFTPRG